MQGKSPTNRTFSYHTDELIELIPLDLIHCTLGTPNVVIKLINIDSCTCILLDGTKSLPLNDVEYLPMTSRDSRLE